MAPACQARGAGRYPLTALAGVEVLGQQFVGEQSAVGAQRRGQSILPGQIGEGSLRR